MTAVPHPDPSLTVAAVARRLGVAPATLRTWDRRYGLGPTEHLAGAHRRYTSADVSRLLTMRRLTLEGVAPSEAARVAREGTDTRPSTVEVLDAYTDAVVMAADPPALAAAAAGFDNAAVRWMLARVHPRDVLAWWGALVEPALGILAGQPSLEQPGQSSTRGLEAAAFAELRSRVAAAAVRRTPAQAGMVGGARGPGSPTAGTSVLAVPTGAGPDLVAHVLATALLENGLATRVLSVATPDAVLQAVADMRPGVILLHIAADEGAGDLLRGLAAESADLPVFVHQEGSAPLDAPVDIHVHRVRTLTGALHEILAVVR